MADRVNYGLIGKYMETVQCYSEAITDAVKGTDLEENWDTVQDKLITIDSNIVHCMSEQPAKESIK